MPGRTPRVRLAVLVALGGRDEPGLVPRRSSRASRLGAGLRVVSCGASRCGGGHRGCTVRSHPGTCPEQVPGSLGPWWWATLIGWSTGVGIARLLIETTSAGLPAIADTVAVAAIAGCVVGVPQAWVLSRRCSGWFWWPAISCVGWTALFPGALPGVGLVWLARSAREDSAP